MIFDAVEKVANAILYEGYMLYPYRPDSTKNRQRWNFGTLYPQAYSDASGRLESSGFHSEFLITGAQPSLEVRLRFLQLGRSERSETETGAQWDQGHERAVEMPPVMVLVLQSGSRYSQFRFAPERLPDGESSTVLKKISGAIGLEASAIAPEVFRISLEVSNTSPTEGATDRETALLQAMISAHAVVHVSEGELVSLLDPPSELAEAAAECRNSGVFPVLAGEEPARDLLLISPIILYDYPQVAPESVGDFHDATEIDEMLTLRVLTLTDEEKEQMRTADPKARAILEQASGLGEDQFRKLHGAVRGLRRMGGKL